MTWFKQLRKGVMRSQRKSNPNESKTYHSKNSNESVNGQEHKEKSPSKSKSDARKFTAQFYGLIDIVTQDDKPAFLVKQDGKLVILHEIEKEGKTHYPPDSRSIPFSVANAEEVIETYRMESMFSSEAADLSTFDALIKYHKDVSELPTEQHYMLLAAWDIHTYFQDQLQYSPIIALFAVPERGKSRTGKSMIYVSYRGMHVESLREAYILRLAEHYQASLFIDVMNPWKKAERIGAEDILLQRFERGTTVARVLFPDRGAFKDTVYFSVFGPTIIGTNTSLHHILDTRSIQINMPPSIRTFENEVTPELSMPLKVRILTLRARNIDITLPDIRKPAIGRLGDISKPLVQIVRQFAPRYESEFLEFIRFLETKRRADKSDTLEAQIIRTICSLGNIVEKNRIPTKVITDALNKDKSEREKINSRSVGRKLTALGFERSRTNTGASAIIWNKEFLERIKGPYGVEETSESSDTHEQPLQNCLSSDVSGVSEVSDPLDLPF